MDYEIADFTAISDWERLTAALEAALGDACAGGEVPCVNVQLPYRQAAVVVRGADAAASRTACLEGIRRFATRGDYDDGLVARALAIDGRFLVVRSAAAAAVMSLATARLLLSSLVIAVKGRVARCAAGSRVALLAAPLLVEYGDGHAFGVVLGPPRRLYVLANEQLLQSAPSFVGRRLEAFLCGGQQGGASLLRSASSCVTVRLLHVRNAPLALGEGGCLLPMGAVEPVLASVTLQLIHPQLATHGLLSEDGALCLPVPFEAPIWTLAVVGASGERVGAEPRASRLVSFIWCLVETLQAASQPMIDSVSLLNGKTRMHQVMMARGPHPASEAAAEARALTEALEGRAALSVMDRAVLYLCGRLVDGDWRRLSDAKVMQGRLFGPFAAAWAAFVGFLGERWRAGVPFGDGDRCDDRCDDDRKDDRGDDHSEEENGALTPPPDFTAPLLVQKVQMLNYCIAVKRARRTAAVRTRASPGTARGAASDLSDLIGEAASPIVAEICSKEERSLSGASPPVEGRLFPLAGQFLTENADEPIWVPVTQECRVMTSDFASQHEDSISRAASEDRVRIQCEQLLSDMRSFKAANPGGAFVDFCRWHSPRDYDATRGVLSDRMAAPDNVWRRLWGAAEAIPARQQRPLFDAHQEASRALFWFSDVALSELLEGLLVMVIGIIDEQMRRLAPAAWAGSAPLAMGGGALARERLGQAFFDDFCGRLAAAERHLSLEATLALFHHPNMERFDEGGDALVYIVGGSEDRRQIEELFSRLAPAEEEYSFIAEDGRELHMRVIDGIWAEIGTITPIDGTAGPSVPQA